MLRRLATIAAALTLAACSDAFTYPTEVTGSNNGDHITVPQIFADSALVRNPNCHGMEGFASPEMLAKIPGCRR